jgi:predicted ATPase
VISIVGPAGIGKTRLARAIADAVRRDRGEAPVWIDCAPLGAADGVATTLASELGVSLGASRDAAAGALAEALLGRGVVAVLDNCEHVSPAVAALATALVAAGARPAVEPGVAGSRSPALLVTSLAPLEVVGERVLRLGPLPLPARDDEASEADGAVRLFAERVRLVERRFAVGDAQRALVGRICRRLDGLPLALELAAARVPLLGLQALADRLDDRFRLLTRSPPGIAHRHATLQAALDWSVSLLEADESAVFQRLGVFVGGFSLALAERVAGDGDGPVLTPALDGWRVIDALGVLVDRSLVLVERGEPVRYRLLETMRAHALGALDQAGESDAVRERHARALAALAIEVDAAEWDDADAAASSDPPSAPPDPTPELDNARAALHWALDRGQGALAVEIGGRLAPSSMPVGCCTCGWRTSGGPSSMSMRRHPRAASRSWHAWVSWVVRKACP